MNEHRRRILQMLAEGQINADEAERLINVMEAPSFSRSVQKLECHFAVASCEMIRRLDNSSSTTSLICFRRRIGPSVINGHISVSDQTIAELSSTRIQFHP